MKNGGRKKKTRSNSAITINRNVKKTLGWKVVRSILITISFIILLLSRAFTESADEKESKFNELVTKLRKDGYNVQYFYDKKFKIYINTQKNAEILNKANYFAPSFGIFTEVSFNQSIKFIDKFREQLLKAEKIYGVQKEYIVAILQVETNFGKRAGKQCVLNALASMYVYGRKWAYNEIKCYLDLESKLYTDPFEIKGSYAGAFGAAQALPTSYKKFGVDFNEDGKIDPNDIEDAIGFVANYLKECGFSKTLESKKQAVYSYNRQKSYIDVIVKYANELKSKCIP